MKQFNATVAARAAVAAHPERPATAIVHDETTARLVVFRLAPGQEVRPHRSASTVMLNVLHGSGLFLGENEQAQTERPCSAGDIAVFAPQELHGMRALREELLLLATITPRPGSA